MCDECGCGNTTTHHRHEPVVGHTHGPSDERRQVDTRTAVLSRNDRLAEQNRGFFRARGLVAINLLSAPGSGKTTIIERTLDDLGSELPMAVIVGDLATENDADRIRRKGGLAVQVTTGEVCHLDAHMVQHALEHLPLDGQKLLFIENVGNLVCPAAFDLGEAARAVILSTTEGEDKPLKYPVIFSGAQMVLITKTDLATATGFDRDVALANIHKVAPKAEAIELSARTGEGMDRWYAFLRGLAARRAAP